MMILISSLRTSCNLSSVDAALALDDDLGEPELSTEREVREAPGECGAVLVERPVARLESRRPRQHLRDRHRPAPAAARLR